MITQDRLQELLKYNPETGEFNWRKLRPGQTPGKTGCSNVSKGYTGIVIDRRLYYAHRLAWLYVYGCWPNRLDHKNGNPSDNRINNLREASPSQNVMNRKAPGSRSGFRGVQPVGKKFVAYVKRKYVGTFSTAEEAHRAFCTRVNELYGEFARYD